MTNDNEELSAASGGSVAGDIATRLRQTRADMIGTADEEHYFDCHEAAGEIERLRQFGTLTRGERRALEFAIGVYPLDDSVRDTLRSLLRRLG